MGKLNSRQDCSTATALLPNKLGKARQDPASGGAYPRQDQDNFPPVLDMKLHASYTHLNSMAMQERSATNYPEQLIERGNREETERRA
jgi:hypothetical protein